MSPSAPEQPGLARISGQFPVKAASTLLDFSLLLHRMEERARERRKCLSGTPPVG
jgi:hypothetical protein